MYKDRSTSHPMAEVIGVLQDLIATSSVIEAAALVGPDGEVIGLTTRRGANDEALRTAIEELLAPNSANLRHVAQGTLGQIAVNAASRRVMVRQSGHNALICTVVGGHGRGGSQMPSITAHATKLASLPAAAPPLPIFGNAAPVAYVPEPAAPFIGPVCPLSTDESARIAALRSFVISALPSVTERVYNAMEAEPQMARYVPNGTARLRQLHLTWLQSLFSGDYGPDFVRRQQEIGRAHVLSGIPPVLFAANMAYLRALLPTALRTSLGEGVLAEQAISTVMRLIDFCHQIFDGNSAELLSKLNAPRRG